MGGRSLPVVAPSSRSESRFRDVSLISLFVAAMAASSVLAFDWLLSFRVRAGTDSALRLSVIMPYLGVDGSYVLARSLGITAMVAATASVMLGLYLGQRRGVRSAVAGTVATLHRVVGQTTIVLVAGHASVPYLSAVPPYGGWATALVPFRQPFSWGTRATDFESIGILSFYLVILIGPTYYLFRRSPRVWLAVHRLSVVAYGLAVLHTLFLGSDFYVAGAVRVMLIAVQVPVVALCGWRLWRGRHGVRPVLNMVGAWVLIGASVGLVVLTGLGIAGAPLGGFRL